MPNLLDIPSEIRVIIYRCLFQDLSVWAGYHAESAKWNVSFGGNSLSGIFVTNKLIRQEALSALYDSQLVLHIQKLNPLSLTSISAAWRDTAQEIRLCNPHVPKLVESRFPSLRSVFLPEITPGCWVFRDLVGNDLEPKILELMNGLDSYYDVVKTAEAVQQIFPRTTVYQVVRICGCGKFSRNDQWAKVDVVNWKVLTPTKQTFTKEYLLRHDRDVGEDFVDKIVFSYRKAIDSESG